jgi:hypothetical protein
VVVDDISNVVEVVVEDITDVVAVVLRNKQMSYLLFCGTNRCYSCCVAVQTDVFSFCVAVQTDVVAVVLQYKQM